MKLNSSTRQAISDKTLKLGKLKFERGKVSEPQIAGYHRSLKLKDTRENEGFTIVSLCCCQDLGVIIHALLSSANMCFLVGMLTRVSIFLSRGEP